MSENYDDNRRDLLRNFLLKVILIIIFVLLIVWLVPKFTVKSTKNTKEIDNVVTTDQVFSDNLSIMKSAARDYFTKDKLPVEVGDTTKITLQELYDQGLLTERIDKNGNACAVSDSYASVTREEKEYLMKVNLKCGKEEDYVLIHLGDYSYCTNENNVCEKESSVSSYTDDYSSKGYGYGYYGGSKGSYRVNGNQSNNGVRRIAKRIIKRYTITKPVTTTRTITTTTNKSTTTSKITTKTIIKKIKKIIKKVSTESDVNDYTDKDEDITPDTPSKSYLYEYAKASKITTYKWGNWSSWKTYKDADGIKAITCDAKDFTCLREVQTKQEFEKVGTYTKYYKKSREESQKLSSYTAKYCKSYNYVVYGSTIYYTTGSTSGYNSTTSGSWSKSGSVTTYSTPPSDSATVRYVLVGADYSDCSETCSTLPKYKYQKYTYTGGTLKKAGTYRSSTDYKLDVTCSDVVSKTIPVYANVTVYDVVERKEPAYAYVKYYRERKRTLSTSTSSDVKWSYYNDRSLLDNGYTYTGQKKEK